MEECPPMEVEQENVYINNCALTQHWKSKSIYGI